MMKPESGRPAFDNIDELLSDKIATHGRDHADQTQPDAPAPEQDGQTAPVEHLALGSGPSGKTVFFTFAVLGIMLLILYRLFNSQQNR